MRTIKLLLNKLRPDELTYLLGYIQGLIEAKSKENK